MAYMTTNRAVTQLGVLVSGSAAADWPAAAQGHEGHWDGPRASCCAANGSLSAARCANGSPDTAKARTHPTLFCFTSARTTSPAVLKDNGPHERVASVARRAQTIVHGCARRTHGARAGGGAAHPVLPLSPDDQHAARNARGYARPLSATTGAACAPQ